jgi:hypothetical protein
MNFLASVTVILLVPTVITGLSSLSSAIVAVIFWKKGWLSEESEHCAYTARECDETPAPHSLSL